MMLENSLKRNIVIIGTIVLLFVFLSKFFGMIGFGLTAFSRVRYLLLFIIPLLFLKNISSKSFNRSVLSKYVRFLLVMPWISLLFKTLFYNEPIINELEPTIIYCFVFLLFFLYKRYEVSEEQLLLSFLIIGLLTFIIQVYQQQNPYMAIFGTKDLDLYGLGETYLEEVKRNGLYRFNVGTPFIACICMFYYWEKILTKRKITVILLFAIFATSVYLYLTRQLIISSLITILLSNFITKKGNAKMWTIAAIALFSAILISQYDVIFEGLVIETNKDSYSTDIRYQCMPFMLEKIFDNPILALTGHGHPQILYQWGGNNGYWWNDVGFIGESFCFGLLWAIAYFIFVYKMLVKYKSIIPLYLRLFILGTLIHCIFLFPYSDATQAFVWIGIIYICDMYITKEYQC